MESTKIGKYVRCYGLMLKSRSGQNLYQILHVSREQLSYIIWDRIAGCKAAIHLRAHRFKSLSLSGNEYFKAMTLKYFVPLGY
jgi:hypothetical protein